MKLIFVVVFAIFMAVHGAPNKLNGFDPFNVLGQLERYESEEQGTQFEVWLKNSCIFARVSFEMYIYITGCHCYITTWWPITRQEKVVRTLKQLLFIQRCSIC